MGGIPVTSFNLLTFILLVLTAWVVVGRFTRSLESNWPLVYYLMVVAHLKAFDGGLADLPRAHRRYFGANLLIVRWLQFICGNGLLSTTYFSGR